MLQNRIEALREARKNGDSGFTLIELLIVIVVLGVLAGIVVFGVAQFRADAVEAAACSAEETVNTAAQAFRAQSPTNAWPTSITQLATAPTAYLETDPSAGLPTGVTFTITNGVSEHSLCP